MNEKILFDTDIGSDIDDALALAYLLKEPRCELLGITTVTSFPEQRAALRALGRVRTEWAPLEPRASARGWRS